MNLLEQYIEEVHSVVPLTDDWTKEFDHGFVKVDITTSCYGTSHQHFSVFSDEEWKDVKEKGYYLG